VQEAKVSDFDDASPANDDRQLDAGIKRKMQSRKEAKTIGFAAGLFADFNNDNGLAIPVARS
jgi:hypothetical protein